MDVLKDLIAVGVLIFSLLFLAWMVRVAWKGLAIAGAWLSPPTHWRHKPDDRIARIYIWQNGGVLVFNHSGHSIVELEGSYDKVRDLLLARLPEEVVFRWGDINSTEMHTITREQFEQWRLDWRPPRSTRPSGENAAARYEG